MDMEQYFVIRQTNCILCTPLRRGIRWKVQPTQTTTRYSSSSWLHPKTPWQRHSCRCEKSNPVALCGLHPRPARCLMATWTSHTKTLNHLRENSRGKIVSEPTPHPKCEPKKSLQEKFLQDKWYSLARCRAHCLYLDPSGDGYAGTPDVLRVGEFMPDETSNGDGRQAHVGNSSSIETGQVIKDKRHSHDSRWSHETRKFLLLPLTTMKGGTTGASMFGQFPIRKKETEKHHRLHIVHEQQSCQRSWCADKDHSVRL